MRATCTRPGGEFDIPPASDVPETIRVIVEGLPARCFDALARRTGVNERRLAELVGISTATVARRKKAGVFRRGEGERIVRIMRVVERSVELFEGDDAGAMRWLKSPDELFENRSPLEYAETEPGAQHVLDVIGRLEHGVYS